MKNLKKISLTQKDQKLNNQNLSKIMGGFMTYNDQPITNYAESVRPIRRPIVIKG